MSDEPRSTKQRWGVVAFILIFGVPLVVMLVSERESARQAGEILAACSADDLSIETVESTERDGRPSIVVRLFNEGAECGLASAPVVEVRVDGEWRHPTPSIVDEDVTSGPTWRGVFHPDLVAVMTVTAAPDADPLRADALRISLGDGGGRLVREELDFVVGDRVELTPFEADGTDN